MNVKIDTKEKFTVISPITSDLAANMTVTLRDSLITYLEKDIPHIILNMEDVETISVEAADIISGLQQQFYEQNASFIVCTLKNNVKNIFEERGLLEIMNTTPTESEAWDMVQMEEIERELLREFDVTDED